MNKIIMVLLSAFALQGCGGGMILGKIYSSNGKMLDFRIEKARRSGKVTAFDPSTGEHFAGQYVGVVQSVAGTSTAITASGQLAGIGTSSVSSNIGNATAYLQGDHGSTLNCGMNIEASFSPHGIGKCTDQAGTQYQVQF
jgi:hypothetical protein